jgi:hypothetical protein
VGFVVWCVAIVIKDWIVFGSSLLSESKPHSGERIDECRSEDGESKTGLNGYQATDCLALLIQFLDTSDGMAGMFILQGFCTRGVKVPSKSSRNRYWVFSNR